MLSFINQGCKDKLSLEAHVIRQWDHAIEQPDTELDLRLLLVNLFGCLHIRINKKKKKDHLGAFLNIQRTNNFPGGFV